MHESESVRKPQPVDAFKNVGISQGTPPPTSGKGRPKD